MLYIQCTHYKYIYIYIYNVYTVYTVYNVYTVCKWIHCTYNVYTVYAMYTLYVQWTRCIYSVCAVRAAAGGGRRRPDGGPAVAPRDQLEEILGTWIKTVRTLQLRAVWGIIVKHVM